MLYPYKGVHVLLQAYAEAYEFFKSRGIKLAIVGGQVDAKYFSRLFSLVGYLGLGRDDVVFLGFLPKDDLRILYRHALSFALPTTLETFGQPLVEAMASRLPIVTTDLDVTREICDDAALYFEADDSHELCVSMKRLVTEVGLRSSLSKKAQRRAENFSWEREVIETFNLLQRIK
jgi:glycosyltransferase involved in cell wall biosynthesis